MTYPSIVIDPPPPTPRWPWKRLALALVLLVGTGIGVYAWLAGGSQKRADALRDCRQGKLAEAEPILTDILNRHPEDTEVRNALARAYTFADRPADALPHLTRLLEEQPDNTEYLKLRMEQNRKLKQREEEYADARRLIQLGSEDDKLRKSSVGLAFTVGRFAEAEELCQECLRYEPRDRGLRLLMANIRRARGDDNGAARILDDLIREDPKNYNALFLRGVLYDENGQPDQAVKLLWKVYHEDPTRQRTCGYQLSLALRKIGQEEEARKILDEVRRLADVQVVNEALKGQPDNLDLQVRMAESLLKDGHTADGLDLLQSVLRKEPNYAPAHLALAAHYEKEGRADLAARHRQLAGGSR
jgi:tetratricopeptide (TPR) repeat protein